VQGSFSRPEQKAEADRGESARPIVRKGDMAWAGGRGGNEFFVALADHPEWKHGHTVFGRVAYQQDVDALRQLVENRPRTVRLGDPKGKKPDVQNFETNVRFTIRKPSS